MAHPALQSDALKVQFPIPLLVLSRVKLYILSKKGEICMNLIDTATAAKKKDCSRNAILNAIRRDVIDGQQTGRYYVVIENTRFKNWSPDPDRQQIGRDSQKEKV